MAVSQLGCIELLYYKESLAYMRELYINIEYGIGT